MVKDCCFETPSLSLPLLGVLVHHRALETQGLLQGLLERLELPPKDLLQEWVNDIKFAALESLVRCRPLAQELFLSAWSVLPDIRPDVVILGPDDEVNVAAKEG